jgi:hypothetical protein
VTAIDPWAEAARSSTAPLEEPLDQITEGATVIGVERHPVYSTSYRCEAWMTVHPWTIDRRSTVLVFRGDVFDQPECVGDATLGRLRRNGADVQTVPVGFTPGDPVIEVFLTGEDAAAVQVGDTFAFIRQAPTQSY